MIYVKTYNEPEIDFKEIRRYARCPEDLEAEISDCLSEIAGKLSYKVCYTELEVTEEPVKTWKENSKSLCKNLENCKRVILFAAGIGIEIDRLIARYSRISPSKALFFQAIGAERIETLCNVFNDDMRSNVQQSRLFLRPRFSPGYGDFSLEAQKDIFRILDCSKRIGVTLNDSLIMSPSKSVTALIGVSECDSVSLSGCRTCSKKDCEFRR